MQDSTTKLIVGISASVWSAFLAILLTPVFVSFVGIEAYGIIALFTTLQVLLSLLDFGIGSTLTRELARLDDGAENAEASHRLARTHEAIYMGLAILAALILVAAAPLIARHWLKPSQLSVDDVTTTLRIGALVIGVQWLSALYGAGLAGLHRQMLLAGVLVPAMTLRSLLTLAAVWLIAPTLQVFFLAHGVFGLGQTLLLRHLFWRAMPGGVPRAAFDLSALKRTGGFTAGMSAATVTNMAVAQSDKLLLSMLLPLESFGFYVLAGALANGIGQIVAPVFSTMYPRFSQIAAKNDAAALRDVFHATAQILAVVVLPVAAILVVFPAAALFLWTGNADLADRGQIILQLLAGAAALYGLMSVLFLLETADGRTAPAIWTNVVLLAVVVPVTYVCTTRYGAIGGGLGWVTLSFVMLALRPPISLRSMSPSTLREWLIADVGQPTLAVGSLALTLKWLLPMPHDRVALGLILFCVGLLLIAAAIMASGRVRPVVASMFGRVALYARS